jgi:hypothetical protein
MQKLISPYGFSSFLSNFNANRATSKNVSKGIIKTSYLAQRPAFLSQIHCNENRPAERTLPWGDVVFSYRLVGRGTAY